MPGALFPFLFQQASQSASQMPGIMLVIGNTSGNKTQSLSRQRGRVKGTHKMHITSRCFFIPRVFKKALFATGSLKRHAVQIWVPKPCPSSIFPSEMPPRSYTQGTMDKTGKKSLGHTAKGAQCMAFWWKNAIRDLDSWPRWGILFHFLKSRNTDFPKRVQFKLANQLWECLHYPRWNTSKENLTRLTRLPCWRLSQALCKDKATTWENMQKVEI